MRKKRYIIGTDVGFRNMGMSLFKVDKNKFKFIDCVVIQTDNKKKKEMSATDLNILRTTILVDGMIDFINANIDFSFVLEGRIEMFGAFEFPHGGSKSKKAAQAMSMATAIVVTFFNIFGIKFENVKPVEVKEAVTANKNASKDDIIKVISKKLKRHTNKINNRIKKSKRSKKKFSPLYEHFADSVGAVIHVRKKSLKYKQFIKGKLYENGSGNC